MQCRSRAASYSCVCAKGFEGPTCQHQVINECASAPCINGNMCVDGVQSYSCKCAAPYGLESFVLDSRCRSNLTIVAAWDPKYRGGEVSHV